MGNYGLGRRERGIEQRELRQNNQPLPTTAPEEERQGTEPSALRHWEEGLASYGLGMRAGNRAMRSMLGMRGLPRGRGELRQTQSALANNGPLGGAPRGRENIWSAHCSG